MRTLSRWFLAAVLALVLALLVALALAIEGQPRVPPRDDVSPADIDRAVALARLHDPRAAVPGQLRRVPLSQRDIDLLLSHAARRFVAANMRARLQPGRLFVQASAAAPFGHWLNVELGLRQTAALPEVERLRVGRLALPSALAWPLLRAFAARRGVQVDALLAVDWIERVNFLEGRMTVSYRIGPDTAKRLRAALVPPVDQERLRAYNERLAAVTQDIAGDEMPLAALWPPLFALAAQRSAAGGDGVEENRAALLSLTFFVNQRPLGLMVPAAYDWPRLRPLYVTLLGRHDFALHFLVSALVAAEAGTPLADAVGVWKELSDARRGGSGFSFNDLAADRAGTRFGELAVREPARLHTRVAAGMGEADFMPHVSDLPEFLSQREFVARYGGVGGAAYNRLLADIEARLDALPAFR